MYICRILHGTTDIHKTKKCRSLSNPRPSSNASMVRVHISTMEDHRYSFVRVRASWDVPIKMYYRINHVNTHLPIATTVPNYPYNAFAVSTDFLECVLQFTCPSRIDITFFCRQRKIRVDICVSTEKGYLRQRRGPLGDIHEFDLTLSADLKSE